MRAVDDYASGKILEDVKKAELKIKAWITTGNPDIREDLEARSEDSKIRHFIASMKTLKDLIIQARIVAVG